MQITLEETGLEVLDLRIDSAFSGRKLHTRDIGVHMAGLQRLSQALLERPDTILQELVSAAVDLCGADSAGISIEKENGSDEEFYHWIATAGVYSGFLNAILPRHPSACGLTLERGHAQHFTVTKKFFDILGVEAPPVLDGLLLPWKTEDTFLRTSRFYTVPTGTTLWALVTVPKSGPPRPIQLAISDAKGFHPRENH